jgi:nitronate monooxygenase
MQVRRQTKQPFIGNYILASPPQSLSAALEAGLPVVQFSWGLPTKEFVAALRQTGAKFGVQVGTAEGARAALDLGADYVVSQGNEAGGHVQSSTPLYELLPRVLEEAKGSPVLVAGGIGHGAKIRAALAAGASGALLGTRFVACRESQAHQVYKDALIRAQAKDTALSVCFQNEWAGATHRTLRNGTLVRWESAGCPSAGKRPGEGDIVATGPDGRRLSRYSADVPRQGYQGTLTDLAMYAGQGVGDVKDVPSARELVDRLWMECLAARP